MTGSRFLAACRGEPVDRPPVWLMRQAGRYLAEYRAVRAQAGDFLGLCHTPEHAIEVTLQPIRRFGFDAAILFSDILVPAQAMGARVRFEQGEGPRVDDPVRSAAHVDALRCPAPEEAVPAVFEAVRGLAAALGETPLIGFAAAPWTLACYLVEGGGSRDFATWKAMTHAEPALARRLLDRIAEYTAAHALAQLRAGARAFQLFDTWAELLSCEAWATWSLPWVNRILDAVRADAPPGTPLLYFGKGSAALLPRLHEVRADVFSIDWRLDLRRARTALGPGVTLQGNLDPTVLLAGPEATAEAAREVLAAGGGQRHVFNLGHGILPTTPVESVEALVEAVRAAGPFGTPP